jgi:YVTN family beta-propeller protein
MARQVDDDFVDYHHDEPKANPVPLKTRLFFVAGVLLAILIGGLVIFKDVWLPQTPPPRVEIVEETSGSELLTYPIPEGSEKLAAAADDVWVLYPETKTVAQFSIQDRRLIRKVILDQEPRDLEAGRGGVWVSGQTQVYRLDSDSGEITSTVATGNQPGDLALIGDFVWVINEADDTVSRIDTKLGEVTGKVNVDPAPFDLAVDKDAVWVAHDTPEGVAADPLLTRINPKTLRRSREKETIRDLKGLALTQRVLWSIHGSEQGLGRISRRTGEPLESQLTRLPAPPVSLQASQGKIWVGLDGEPSLIESRDRNSGNKIDQVELGEKAILDLSVNETGAWVIVEEGKVLARWQKCSADRPCLTEQIIEG